MRTPTITSREFKAALSEIRPTQGQLNFLQEHYRSTGRVSTMTKLAEAAGYKNYGGVNLHYGGLAHEIAVKLGRRPPATKVTLLVDFVPRKQISNKDWVVHMKPAFASALRSAGWVR